TDRCWARSGCGTLAYLSRNWPGPAPQRIFRTKRLDRFRDPDDMMSRSPDVAALERLACAAGWRGFSAPTPSDSGALATMTASIRRPTYWRWMPKRYERSDT